MSKRACAETIIAIVLLAIIGGQASIISADSIILAEWEIEYILLREHTNALLKDYLECQESKSVKTYVPQKNRSLHIYKGEYDKIETHEH